MVESDVLGWKRGWREERDEADTENLEVLFKFERQIVPFCGFPDTSPAKINGEGVQVFNSALFTAVCNIFVFFLEN